ncbi:fatty acid synthase-like [Vespa mandarinia]|uniref:fatty acid synthase-like n=1 Tax=Vespa mandarinia TaxID=7446 RepID=UPI001619B4B0|nr:fatty acid synthase-like [Vespa mandarinia]
MKFLDENAAGYARSESIAVLFLPNAKNAKRIYAKIFHTKRNCDGYKEEEIMFPSRKIQSIFFKKFYKEYDIPTTCVSYIEAHGTGTKVGDPEKMNAIDHIFTEGRTKPLKVGTIKSNIGYTEAASGINSIIKAIISMKSSLTSLNINFNRPRKDVKCLTEGRIKIVTKTTSLDGEYISINSFRIGCANAHILLKSNPKTKINKGLTSDDLLKLVAISGCTEETVITILNDVLKI